MQAPRQTSIVVVVVVVVALALSACAGSKPLPALTVAPNTTVVLASVQSTREVSISVATSDGFVPVKPNWLAQDDFTQLRTDHMARVRYLGDRAGSNNDLGSDLADVAAEQARTAVASRLQATVLSTAQADKLLPPRIGDGVGRDAYERQNAAANGTRHIVWSSQAGERLGEAARAADAQLALRLETHCTVDLLQASARVALALADDTGALVADRRTVATAKWDELPEQSGDTPHPGQAKNAVVALCGVAVERALEEAFTQALAGR